jgi:hypothetical protein
MQATVPILIALLSLAPFWCFVVSIFSKVSGWAALASKYRTTSVSDGKRLSFQSAALGSVNYGSCLTVVVGSAGLYLKVFPLFRAGHPPLLIPWTELHDLREKKFLRLFRLVEMQVGTPTIATLTLPFHLIEQRPLGD